MSLMLLNSNFDMRRRCRLNLTTILVFIILCMLFIYYLCVCVTTFSSTIASNNTNNDITNMQSDIQSTPQNTGSGRPIGQQIQDLPLAAMLPDMPKVTSKINSISTIEDMSCLEKIIINATREEIASQVKDFMGPYKSGFILESNGNPIRNVILSTYRSGSSFFGDILNSMPGSYYFYEPLRHYGDIQIREQNLASSAIESLKQLMNCNFDYKYINEVFWHYNTRQFKFCDVFPSYDLCRKRIFLQNFCKLFPIQTIKEVRLRPNFSEPLLMDTQLNVKIILLIRDPRGIVSSRKHEYWCYTGKECRNYENVCKDLVSDYVAARHLTEKYPDRFKVLRYEDLSVNPFNVTEKVLIFYGLPFHKNVQDFLTSHTTYNTGSSMSTFRDSKNTAFSWQRNLNFSDIDKIQAQCTEAMNVWGYKKVNSQDELNSGHFYPLLPFAFNKDRDIETESQILQA